MPSHKFVRERSQNFTSHAPIRFPPTTPINPVFAEFQVTANCSWKALTTNSPKESQKQTKE